MFVEARLLINIKITRWSLKRVTLMQYKQCPKLNLGERKEKNWRETTCCYWAREYQDKWSWSHRQDVVQLQTINLWNEVVLVTSCECSKHRFCVLFEVFSHFNWWTYWTKICLLPYRQYFTQMFSVGYSIQISSSKSIQGWWWKEAGWRPALSHSRSVS